MKLSLHRKASPNFTKLSSLSHTNTASYLGTLSQLSSPPECSVSCLPTYLTPFLRDALTAYIQPGCPFGLAWPSQTLCVLGYWNQASEMPVKICYTFKRRTKKLGWGMSCNLSSNTGKYIKSIPGTNRKVQVGPQRKKGQSKAILIVGSWCQGVTADHTLT